jgi:hypothetical protein
MSAPYFAGCRACNRQFRIESIPPQCPYCGVVHQSPAPAKTDAEVKADALAARFRLAAERAKGNF